jgi:FkbM family methyltransferase
LVSALTLPFGRRLSARLKAVTSSVLAPVVNVRTTKGELRFYCTSAPSAKRATNFLEHEADTREWIDRNIRAGEHVWDVGANVGAYTLYACLTPEVTATSFEPVAATFALLATNLELNGMGARVTPLCVALSRKNEIATLFLSSFEAGSAMHALGKAEAVHGPFDPAKTVRIAAMRGDDVIKHFDVRRPDHIKIDVDGHEMAVLEGMREILPMARTVWIEMVAAGDQSGENARIAELLQQAGYRAAPLESGRLGRNRLFVNGKRAG